MFKPITLSFAAAGLLAGGAALAQPAAGAPDLTRAAAQERAASAFAKLDANADGRLDAADREARMRARFDATDTDGDGQLSFAEVAAARGERQDRRAGPSPRKMRGMRGAERPMARADTDRDGAISQAEFTAAALARFERADADGDGTVTRAERRALREERRERRGQMQRQRG